MKNLQDEIIGMKLHELCLEELIETTGGWAWLDNVAEAVGFAVGYIAHGVIDAILIVSGNYEKH